MRSVIFLALVCVCVSCVAAKPKKSKKEPENVECRFDNSKGSIKPYFTSKSLEMPTYPCGMLLAKFKCGNVRATVRLVNKADIKNKFLVTTEKLITTIEHKPGNTRHVQVLKTTQDNIAAFLKKQGQKNKKPEKDNVHLLWQSSFEGSPAPENETIKGIWDAANNMTVINVDDLVIKYKIDDDTTVIVCRGEVTGATKFPNALCGSPDDEKTVIDELLPKSDLKGLQGARLDFAQLSKQNDAEDFVKGKDCSDAKIALEDVCDDKKESLATCHRMYNHYNGEYGKCIRRKSANPFKFYISCVKTLCNDKNIEKDPVNLSKDDCDILNKVNNDCKEMEGEPMHPQTLMDKGNCWRHYEKDDKKEDDKKKNNKKKNNKKN